MSDLSPELLAFVSFLGFFALAELVGAAADWMRASARAKDAQRRADQLAAEIEAALSPASPHFENWGRVREALAHYREVTDA